MIILTLKPKHQSDKEQKTTLIKKKNLISFTV
jgi:hypothetical protein